MKFNDFVPALFAILALCSSVTLAARKPSDSVLLTSIKTLTLRQGQKTSHRRVSAIPQLTCSGPGCKHYEVDVMRCKNAGSDYDDDNVQWTCTASLPDEFRLGSTDVVCEGYESPNDPYILKGSCGVNYRLLLTDAGKEKFGDGSWFGGGKSSKHKNYTKADQNESAFSYLFTLIFLGVLFWIVYSMYKAYRDGPNPRRPARRGGGWGGFGGWGGGGGGGGGNDGYDPPPPYPGKSNQQAGWQPGFWSGALGGAAAGYLAGNRGQGSRYNQPPVRQTGGSWFGSSDNGWGAGPSRSSPRSSPTISSSRHESTGFGSTSRR